eukprot:353041-Chlamydomonas_euryale.AAC.5
MGLLPGNRIARCAAPAAGPLKCWSDPKRCRCLLQSLLVSVGVCCSVCWCLLQCLLVSAAVSGFWSEPVFSHAATQRLSLWPAVPLVDALLSATCGPQSCSPLEKGFRFVVLNPEP